MRRVVKRVVQMIVRPRPKTVALVPMAIACVVLVMGGLEMDATAAPGESRVDALLSRMSLEEKVGQMVMAGFPGKLPEAEVRTLIEKWHLGGVILFSRNLSDPFQTAYLVNELQKMAASSGAGIPLFVAADQEGGYVTRLPGATPFPGNMGLGAAGDAELARRVAEATARELRACGINMNFAPVVDVNSNPSNPVIGIRSFGESPEAVARLGVAMIQGFQKEGVSATAKHFPGHGDTSLDSHIDLPTVPHDRKRLKDVELKPFQAAVDAGVDAIMTAHVTFPAVEPKPGMPATLSRAVLTGLLRQEMGFGGLIVTDAMEMGAIVKNFGLGEAAVMAVNAGADMVLIGWPKDWQDAVRVADALVQAAKSGEIPMARVDESVRRILSVKEKRGILASPLVDANRAKALVGSDADRKLALDAARRAICLVRDAKGLVPLSARSAGRLLVVFPKVGTLTQVEDESGEPTSLASYLRPALETVDEVSMPTNPDAAQREDIAARAQRYDTVIILTYRAWSSAGAGQAALVSSIAAKHRRVIAVALREPYDLRKYDTVGTYLAAFNASSVSMEALADVLLGRAKPTGRLPVQIPGMYPVGHRL
ncbi:MAG: beta-N-acetylhexosaminidase [Firmicutes bacterium]|nr:beta-N-acetylhexosaminidase [Bacillota bacterium]